VPQVLDGGWKRKKISQELIATGIGIENV